MTLANGPRPNSDTVGEFAAVPTTGGKSGLCGPESPLSSQIPDGSGGNIERTPNSPTVSLSGLGPNEQPDRDDICREPWWAVTDLNRRPSRCKRDALPLS